MSHKKSWSQRALWSKGQPLEDGGDGDGDGVVHCMDATKSNQLIRKSLNNIHTSHFLVSKHYN